MLIINIDLADGAGNWTSEGCTVDGNADGVVSCACNHLTNFGILVVSSKLNFTCS